MCTGLFFLLFVLYWWLLAKLVGSILESPKLKEKHWIFIGIFNYLVLLYFWNLESNAILLCGMMMTIMFVEFMLFYSDHYSGALLCTLSCFFHVTAIFILMVGGVSLVTGHVPYEIMTSDSYVLWCGVASFFLLDFAILLVLKLIPLSKVRLLNQHSEQRQFINAWLVVNILLLICLESLFYNANYPAYLAGSQIVASLTLFIGLYVILFFSIKTSVLLGYKEKNIELKQTIQLEQQYRNLMVRDAIVSYEVNMTQDCIIKGYEEFKVSRTDMEPSYSNLLIAVSQKLIYSEDIENFIKNCGRTNILKIFEKGEREYITEYRRLLENNTYVWVRAICNLIQDFETGDVKAFVCVKNIDEEKKNQLELQNQAQRDPLTGLFNRSTFNTLIEEYLSFCSKQTGSAFFMIDVDNFKTINDNLGHIFGDAVLCELANKLTRICRSDDIVGRMGGDEYVILLKGDNNIQIVQERAEEICKAFQVTYPGIGQANHSISASIGISYFPRDGMRFKELYNCADIALYVAKGNGKNGYKIYDGSDFSGYTSCHAETQEKNSIPQKTFCENRIEYIFKMLYQSDNPMSAICSVLELVTRYFSLDRGYIFQRDKDEKTYSNTFEWCANKELLESNNCYNIFHFDMFEKKQKLGFIGFDLFKHQEILDVTQVDELTTICNIIATFFVKQHNHESTKRNLLVRQEVLDYLANYIYVIAVETFEILFLNESIRKLKNNSKKEEACYRFFRGKTEQCEDCPMKELQKYENEKLVKEIYNEKLEIWMETSASLMRWTDGTLACLINCVDITKQKEEHLSYIEQLEKQIYVDPLTKGMTYQKFQIEAQHILDRTQKKRHYIIKFDISNFKLINQIYGFERGNDILCMVSKALEKTVQNENEIFARVNNDEFITLFELDDEIEIDLRYKNFHNLFKSFVESDFSFQCRFPHGIYVIELEDNNKMEVHDVYEKVNMAHKVAKENKTVDFVFYNEEMTKEALRIKEIENKMVEALFNHEFLVYLQPKYYLNGETIGGAEALTRWDNQNKEFFFPNMFIPIFEQNGFIQKLDFYIFQKVCQIIRTWMIEGIEPITVSVNFSRQHLGDTEFVKKLCEISDNEGVEHKYLEIEITETAFFDNIDTLKQLLTEIHENGFSMSMDDFGSGYSSLGLLKDLEVDVIKMDRSFFVEQRDEQRSRIVVGSVIQMANNLGIHIVAEGVEEQVHIDFLRELNCDMVQGYYYAKPMPMNAFTELLYREKGVKL